MNATRKSLDELERQADAKRRALSASVDEMRLQLQPAALVDEAGSRLRIAAKDVLHRAAERAGTPKGIGTAAAAVAVGVLSLASRVRFARRTPKFVEAPVEDGEFPTTSTIEPPRDDDHAKMLATLAAALVTGALLARLVPPLAREKQVLGGIGGELRMAFEQWAKREVTQLAQRQGGESLRLANAIALGLGLLLATAGARRAKDLDDASPSRQ
jgi:hypothetical protein